MCNALASALLEVFGTDDRVEMVVVVGHHHRGRGERSTWHWRGAGDPELLADYR